MASHMKTTIEISDSLLAEARSVASREGVTMRELVEQGLQQVLRQRRRPVAFKLRKASFKGKGLSESARKLNWDQLRELSYGGRGS